MKCLCQNCDHQLSPDERFCPECGEKNDSVLLSGCQFCYQLLQPGAKFCGHCGMKVDNVQSDFVPELCTGIKEDGSPCDYRLLSNLSFCPACGTKKVVKSGSSAASSPSSAGKKDIVGDTNISKQLPQDKANDNRLSVQKEKEKDEQAAESDQTVDDLWEFCGKAQHDGFSPNKISDVYKEPTPDGYKEPTPDGYKEPIPSGYKEPIPSGYKEPTPSGYKEPTPGGYKEPRPGESIQPIPCGHSGPTPSSYNEPTPDSSPDGNNEPTPAGTHRGCGGEAGDGDVSVKGQSHVILNKPGSHVGKGSRHESEKVPCSEHSVPPKESEEVLPGPFFRQYANDSFVKKEICTLNLKAEPLNNKDIQNSLSDHPRNETDQFSGDTERHQNQNNLEKGDVVVSAEMEGHAGGGASAVDHPLKDGSSSSEESETEECAENNNLDGESHKYDEGNEKGIAETKITKKSGGKKKRQAKKGAETKITKKSGGKKKRQAKKGGQQTTAGIVPGANDEKGKEEEPNEKKTAKAVSSSGRSDVKQKSGHTNAGISPLLSNADGMVAVVFHVIISDLWEEMDPLKYPVFLRFQPAALGSFNPTEDKHRMTYTRKTDWGFLFEGKVMMEKHLRNSGFSYKYVIKKPPGKDGKTKVVWELVQRKDDRLKPELINRSFSTPESEKKFAGEWHRYDGVAYFPGCDSGLLNSFKNFLGIRDFKGKVTFDAVSCAVEFLPSAEQICMSSQGPAPSGQTMESYLEKVKQVMDSLKHTMRDHKQEFVDESLVHKAIDDALVKPIAKKIVPGERSVTLGLFLLLLPDELFKKSDMEYIQFLCRSLLISPKMNNMTCADLDSIASHFPANMTNKSAFASRILSLIECTVQYNYYWQHASDPSWLYCVPLLHLLQEKSMPYRNPEPSSRFRDSNGEWWGLAGLSSRKSYFMFATKNGLIAKDVINILKPAFQLDPLFIRTFVASLGLTPLLPILMLDIVPVDVMAATLAHHIGIQGYLEYKQKEDIECCISMIISKLAVPQKTLEHWTLREVTCRAEIIRDLHEKVLQSQHIVTKEIILNTTYLMFMALDHIALVEQNQCKQNESVEGVQTWRQSADEVTRFTCSRLSNQRDYHGLLKMWDTLLSRIEEEINHAELKQTLKNLLAEEFEINLAKMPANDKLEIYLAQYKVAPAFAHILNKLAFGALEEAFQMGSKHLSRESIHLISLLSDFIEKNWRKKVHFEDEEDVLQFVMTWAPMVNYLNRFGKGENVETNTLNPLAAKIVNRALDCVKNVLESLRDGSILIKTLQLLTSNRQHFLAVVKAAKHEQESDAACFDLRVHEFEAFRLVSTQLDGVLEFCQRLLNTEDQQDVLKSVEDLRDRACSLPLTDMVDIALPDSIKDLKTYKPNSNPWKLSQDVCTVLPVFKSRISSYVFRKFFVDGAKNLDVSTVAFWEAFWNVWSNVSKDWHGLCQQMIDGTITLKDIEKIFSMFRSEDGSYKFAEINQELHKIDSGDSGHWVTERIKQFECYVSIKHHVKAAAMLVNVQKAYGIEGDFKDIHKINKLSQDKSLPVKKVDPSILQLCTILRDITNQDMHSLEHFVDPRCIGFVSWLRENMKDGVKELHVFVDLAFISAGEEPWAIGRVNCFHAAAIGYAPLIFIDEKLGCDHLLQQCKLVFANVKNDPKLPDKLVDSSRYLEWFKDVQKSHGSVEKTSLSQVGNINLRGVFRVGKGENTRVTLPSVIRLKVSEDADSKESRDCCSPLRSYSYEELLDLQSRLMLVAGPAEKGNENADRFMRIMDSLVRLGKTYVHLCSDGCVLFLDWTVEFLCDVNRPVCCISQFADQGKLKGHRSSQGQDGDKTEDLEDFIAGVANFLEQCHAKWLQYVDQKRQEYPELNFYTIEQLVFLQKELIKVGSGDVSKFVFPMVSLLNANSGPDDLECVLQEAMALINQRAQSQHQPQHPPPLIDDDTDESEHFVTELMDSGFSRALALQALKEVGSDDIANGIMWCMNHESDVEEVGEEEQNQNIQDWQEEHCGKTVGQRLEDWVTRKQTITQSAIGWLDSLANREKGTTLKSLTGNLASVWDKFLETVSSSGMDFLSLEHLGIVLTCLAAKDNRKFKRSLPPSFKPKIPNLIICPKSEVLNAVTYMYMFPEDGGAPLPQADEVLLCTQNTTFQQVDIFLRRAFFGSKGKVHCLAFADSLDYDVGEKTEKKLKEYTTIAVEQDYRLVVVCTAENEFRARIVAALEKFRQPHPSLISSSKVQKYLHVRFANVENQGEIAASSHDPENLCVRVVKSNRSGVGKTLYKERLRARLEHDCPGERGPVAITIPLHSRVADTQDIAANLLVHTLDPGTVLPRIVHLDISYQVQEGVDHLLFNLLVLGCVCDSDGRVWLRSNKDLYLVETMPLVDQKDPQRQQFLVHQIFDVLPSLNCWSPAISLNILKNPSSVKDFQKYDRLFDDEEFHSELYQRPFQYLSELDKQRPQSQAGPQGDATAQKVECLDILLRYCGVVNPSWSELTHFVGFLNKQLEDFENSVFCGMATCQDLPGFSHFVLRFLIQMSRDFATRSLKISEESLDALLPTDTEHTDIQEYQMRRTWESSPHPYIFFNPDENSMTFLGFSIDPTTFNLLDQETGKVLVEGIMNAQLFQALLLNRVPLAENFDELPREDRLVRLYRVLGLFEEEIFDENNQIIDPDDTYELTTDNVKKILAIYMRFRCNIPVIVMGETGCGKTRLVKFLCALQTPRDPGIKTMVLVKVHGGITSDDIIEKVMKAEKVAQNNAASVGHRPVYTVLFFDEANTTEAVGVIKEVMCDGTLRGQRISLSQSLKMVAACNPYRKHSDKLIERLENAGLGYHVDAEKTVDKLGHVPMRRLVYRVQPLPQSMLPLVWDFGQLNTRVEELYIHQMVRRYVRNGQLDQLDDAGMNVLCNILMESQEFMRQLADECSFVSLRDVDRTLTVASWFLKQARESGILFTLLDEKLDPVDDEDEYLTASEDGVSFHEDEVTMTNMTQALVLSLGVCYRACLRSKKEYDQYIITHFEPPFVLPESTDENVNDFALITERCQDVFLDNVRLEDNIAKNQALKENVFMMVVCTELRIPLFLVGKPGSSKSLAKTIVSDAMQGNSAYSELFKTLKQAQMVSFQCSPLATADGILGIFRQCAQFQKDKNMDKFVSVVVLDEVGLAEDSPKMPLKTLHPLLEDGCPGDEVADDSKKVAFIGISNWALDPAKMNRGILVQRDVPDLEELTQTARGICTTQNDLALLNVQKLIPEFARAYLDVFEEAKRKREFFGLRDFYSLVKMVYTFAAQTNRCPSQRQLVAAIRRNFGGLDTIDPVESFKKVLPSSLCDQKPQQGDPDCTPSGLIKAALSGEDMGGESRYLLLLTENYGGLSILSEHLLTDHRTIFGSSFPKDQEYTQICRNINSIKMHMETGKTVILLNLDNLYESLYDALNQYYAMLGGERYVDLGLGTHRVKCRVHRQFRLIVVAEKQAVYEKFPIPLINRLEKHFLTLNNIMSKEQLTIAKQLESWALNFVSSPASHTRSRVRAMKKETIGDVFIGYHPDAAPAIVLKVWDMLNVASNPEIKQQVLAECQHTLLWCATPDAVVRAHDKHWSEVYYKEQQHDHLLQYLQQRLQQHIDQRTMLLAQVTTNSKLLTEQERSDFINCLPVGNITLLSLQAFDTKEQFCQKLGLFFSSHREAENLLIVQCDSGDVNQNLVKCAQYCLQDVKPDFSSHHHVLFIIQLPRIAGACFTGFLGGNWHCLHIDDLRSTDGPMPPITCLQDQTPSQLILAPLTLGQMQWEDGLETSGQLQQVQMDLDATDMPMEVDVTDVQIKVEQGMGAVTDIRQPQGFDPQYVRNLFTSCVQAAVALVRDTEEGIGNMRATKRINILLRLLEENTEFFSGLHKLVGSIMKEREQKMYQADSWLEREAAKQDSVNKAGTFRRSWMQYMENKVVPVLAGVIAYLDTNHNLDLVCPPALDTDGQSTPSMDWVTHAWLAILQDECQLNYKSLLSTSGKEELEEFTVHHTGAGALPFTARLPFSWLLWDQVESAIVTAKQMNGDLLDSAGRLLDQSVLGKCLHMAVGDCEDNLRQLFHLYISDLLHCTMPLTAPQHRLLCICVEKGRQQLNIDLVQLGVGQGVVALHMLLEQMQPRLQAVADMICCRPNAVEALNATNSGACVELLAVPDEMTEDMAVLRLVVEEVQPRPSQLEKMEGCQEWLTHYQTVAPVVVRVLTDCDINSALLSSSAADSEGREEVVVNTLPFGPRCRQQLRTVKSLWTRVTTLKLFLDYIGPLRQGPDKLRKALDHVKLQLLFKLLDEDVDMKQRRSLANVDKFLKHANGHMLRGLLGNVGQCTYCHKKLESAPVELPCKHVLCNSCYRDCCHGNRAGATCPECDVKVPQNFDPKAKLQNREAAELLGQYQRQVSGFLMALVSKLCFAGKEPPDPEAVKHIFGYIIHKSKGKTLLQTKHMTVHDDLIDPTPVLRSFLLRLLLKHSEKEVYSYLDEFLQNAQQMVDQEMPASSDAMSGTPTLLEFSLLIVHCMEDLHHEQAAVSSHDLSSEERMLSLADMLHDSMGTHKTQLSSLYSLGRLRYALSACARILHEMFVVSKNSTSISDELDNLLFELRAVCEGSPTNWQKKFLVKQLCREYGVQDYRTLVKLAETQILLQWIVIEEYETKVEAVADRYLVVGEDYRIVRDHIAEAVSSGDFEDLKQSLQGLGHTAGHKEVILLLALHREINMSVPSSPQARSTMANHVSRLIQECNVLRKKEVVQNECNELLGKERTLLNMDQQSFLCLVRHLYLTLGTDGVGSNVLNPLRQLAFQPLTMTTSYLPTMPEDETYETIRGLTDNATLWRCPQGHRYVIGDCGRPCQTSTCPQCGSQIGGVNHREEANNAVDSGVDQTRRGHILGPAAKRSKNCVPERLLSSAECAILRLVTHAALYLGASHSTQVAAVSRMVFPEIAPQHAAGFFWDHLLHDVQVLQKVLGRSRDDVFIVLHHMFHIMAQFSIDGKASTLPTKEERKLWEGNFARSFISPLIQRFDAIVRDTNHVIVSDIRTGVRGLLKMVYEEGERRQAEKDCTLWINPAVWHYRPPITVDHFFRQFHLQLEANSHMRKSHAVLKLFQEKRHILHALHYVPAILAGQRHLMMQLNRRLDRAEAATVTIEEVMAQHERCGLGELLANFSKAWEIVKEHLIGFQCKCPVKGVLVSLPVELHNATVTKASPVAVLLPSLQGPGLCSFLFLQFLFSRNNDFLESYLLLVGQRFENAPVISVRAITESHLIGCLPERDLLPMVLSHCNYNLMMGGRTTLEYDFKAFQQQLEDSLLQCKARVQKIPESCFDVETMAYRADTTTSRLFKILRQKIYQECLSPAERRQIWTDMQNKLPDICQSIDNLNTALSYLKALGGDPTTSLHEFMSNSLRMKNTIHSRKAQQMCSLTHVQSLWVTLCYQRAFILAMHHQDAFDGVDGRLREELSREQQRELEAMCQQMSVERLELLLLQLFECIMLHLSQPQTVEDDTRPETYGLRDDVLLVNLEVPPYNVEPVEMRSGLFKAEDLQTFPEDLQGRHATSTWILCCAQLVSKCQMNL